VAILDPRGQPIGDVDLTDEQAAALMAEEMRATALDGPAIIALDPLTALSLCGLLQLALRHPNMSDARSAVDAARLFVDSIREYFADAPTVLAIIDRGDNPQWDR
jgi:hypothetical protein